MSYGFDQLHAWDSFPGDLEVDQFYQECSSKEQLENVLKYNSQIEKKDVTDFVQLSLALSFHPGRILGCFSSMCNVSFEM